MGSDMQQVIHLLYWTVADTQELMDPNPNYKKKKRYSSCFPLAVIRIADTFGSILQAFEMLTS